MKPIGITEQLMYTTVRLTADNGSCGTGYFYDYRFGDNTVPVILTNKHVVNDNANETMTCLLHLTKDGNSAEGNHSVRMSTHWSFHPTKDLCFTYFAPVEEQIFKTTGKKFLEEV